jgi:hypothetical protein
MEEVGTLMLVFVNSDTVPVGIFSIGDVNHFRALLEELKNNDMIEPQTTMPLTGYETYLVSREFVQGGISFFYNLSASDRAVVLAYLQKSETVKCYLTFTT